MKLYILRHGEAEDDINNTYGGVADDPLIEKGKLQAVKTAQLLKNKGIQAILTSPLRRASQTAEIISSELGGDIKVTVIEDLRERNSYGVLTGVNKDEAKKLFKHIFDKLKEKPGYSREPLIGAEDFDIFLNRVSNAFDQVVEFVQKNEYETIAIVSHGTFTRALFEHVLKIGDIKLEPTEVLTVNFIPAQVEFERLLLPPNG